MFEDVASIPEATLKEMLELEVSRRKSQLVQAQYARVEADEGDESWMEVTAELQRMICREFGFDGTDASKPSVRIYLSFIGVGSTH